MLLDGQEPSIPYGELHVILKRITGCVMVAEGPFRYWKHPENAEFLQVRDNGQRPMYPGYVRDAATWLRVLRDKGVL